MVVLCPIEGIPLQPLIVLTDRNEVQSTNYRLENFYSVLRTQRFINTEKCLILYLIPVAAPNSPS
jgi:hypothetical protein